MNRYLYGVTGGIRTPDRLLRRQMLYPTELRSHIVGGDAGIRTADKPFDRGIAKVLLEQFCTELVFCCAMLPLHHISKIGRSPQIRTAFTPVKSRGFTVKVCNPYGASGGTRTPKILILSQTRIPIPSPRLIWCPLLVSNQAPWIFSPVLSPD